MHCITAKMGVTKSRYSDGCHFLYYVVSDKDLPQICKEKKQLNNSVITKTKKYKALVKSLKLVFIMSATEVMMLTIQLCITGIINNILKHYNTKLFFKILIIFHNITIFTLNAALVSIRDSSKTFFFKSYWPKTFQQQWKTCMVSINMNSKK